MASADWTVLGSSLSTSTIMRGVSAGFSPPAGGGSFVYGFHSLATTPGAAGLFTNQLNFAPMAKGCRISGAVKRAISGGATNFAPMIFCGLQGNTVNDKGYLLGLSDADPHHIVLRKGSIITSIPDDSPGTNGVLARSTATFAPDTYLHLRLDQIVNANGDVVLVVAQNDLTLHNVDSPTWVAVPGMSTFVDDALGVNSGSLPFTSGYAGFAFYSKDVTRRAYFDQMTIARQL
jgi:hypothetical protein